MEIGAIPPAGYRGKKSSPGGFSAWLSVFIWETVGRGLDFIDLVKDIIIITIIYVLLMIGNVVFLFFSIFISLHCSYIVQLYLQKGRAVL